MKIALRSRPAKCVRSAVPLVVAALLGSASAAGAGGFKISEKLTATAAAPRARGRAVVVVRGSDRKVRVAARGLQESTTHDVILDRVKIGTLTTSGRGNGRARFASRPHLHDQYLGTDPRGKTIILRRADAAAVLVAHIPGSDDLIRCCLPGDEGTECEHRAVDELAPRLDRLEADQENDPAAGNGCRYSHMRSPVTASIAWITSPGLPRYITPL